MPKFAKRIEIMNGEVDKLMVLINSLVNGNVISFGGGAPALEAYPMEQLNEIAQAVFQRTPAGYGAFKYGSAMGNDDLRKAVRDVLLAPRGLKTELGNIMITAGGIQPMTFMSQLYLDPGDVVLVESPSFVQTSMIFKMFEAKIVPCAMADDGLVMEDVEEKIKKYNPKFIYTVPTFQNPTGITMSLEKRKRLAELASQYDVIVLEDDPYREIRYSGEELPYIKSFDTTGNVVLANSFSKIFAPGARMGYLVADEKIIQKFFNLKLGNDTCTNGVAQALCAEFFARGLYPQHLENLCNIYRSRRDAMIKAMDESFPEGTKHTYPDGGYYVWVELPEGLDATALKGEIAEKTSIVYGDGSIFFSEGNEPGAGARCMRMNFTGLPEDVIDVNIRKLGAFFCEKLGK